MVLVDLVGKVSIMLPRSASFLSIEMVSIKLLTSTVLLTLFITAIYGRISQVLMLLFLWGTGTEILIMYSMFLEFKITVEYTGHIQNIFCQIFTAGD